MWKFWPIKKRTKEKLRNPNQEYPNLRTPQDHSPRFPPREAEKEQPPQVIVDFIFQDDLFFINIKNIGQDPAYQVTVHFDPEIRGPLDLETPSGSKKFSDLPIFQKIEFLAPQKEITLFLDSATLYFARREPTKIAVTVTYRDFHQQKYTSTIPHDLEIYRHLPQFTRRYIPTTHYPSPSVGLPPRRYETTEKLLLPTNVESHQAEEDRLRKPSRHPQDSTSFVITRYIEEERIDSE